MDDYEAYYEPDLIDYEIKICPVCGCRLHPCTGKYYIDYECYECGYEE